MLKRTLDITVAGLSLVVLSPLFILIALAVWIDSGRPIFFAQERVGRHFRRFRILKFRTMVADAATRGAAIAVAGDSRVTRIGRFLRRTHLDELPQLVNVLRGDMSLVGPRPELPEYVDLFRSDYERVLHVRPGITDPASIKYRDEASILAGSDDPERDYVRWILPDKLQLAKDYVNRASLSVDAFLLLETLLTGAAAIPRTIRHVAMMTGHLVLVAVANYWAFQLRFDGAVPPNETDLYRNTVLALIATRAAFFLVFRFYEGMWRFAGLWDVRRIVLAVAGSTIIFVGFVTFVVGRDYPRSIYLIDSLLLICLLSGLRLVPRLWSDLARREGRKRVLIIGAGGTAERLIRELLTSGASDYEPIGLIDDDEVKQGRRIHGVPVLGTTADLEKVARESKPDEVLLAIGRPSPKLCGAALDVLAPLGIPLRSLAGDTTPGHSLTRQLRSVALEDLLTRAPVGLDNERVRGVVAGKRILVTGAGGSIGSELCRQLADMGPGLLVMLDRFENGVHGVSCELADKGVRCNFEPVIADITDAASLNRVFQKYRPQIVLHAAAHKHVPLMEHNPCEAIRNNVTGTRLVFEAAVRVGVERFLFISTDKAANPASVMGATKRLGEMIVAAGSQGTRLRAAVVRFGNVLGSNGSVVPRFVSQIQQGGPVTVTHPDVKRYFMLVNEAVRLVLQSLALVKECETFVLDMGPQVKLVDLARHLIQLSGSDERAVRIEFIGLRPGEKLSEELVETGETVQHTSVPGIHRIQPRQMVNAASVKRRIANLEAIARNGDGAVIWPTLTSLLTTASVDEYRLEEVASAR